jgi:hypothetical protein
MPLPDKPIIRYSGDPVNHIFDITLNLNNPEIEKLISDGSAMYCCEIECQRTVFRDSVMSDSPNFALEIPRKSVAGEIELTTTVVVTQQILDYNNAGFHPDYSSYHFSLEPGDLLCFFGKNITFADAKFDKLKAVSTFMQILPTDKDYSYVDLDKNKIYLYMPQSLYDTYKGPISHNQSFVPALHASIALNAIVYGILNYEQYKDKLWAETIHFRVSSEPEFENMDLSRPSDAIPIAQILLGDPYRRMFDSMCETLNPD